MHTRYTIGLEKVVSSTFFIAAMHEVAVAPISDVPRNKRVLGTK